MFADCSITGNTSVLLFKATEYCTPLKRKIKFRTRKNRPDKQEKFRLKSGFKGNIRYLSPEERIRVQIYAKCLNFRTINTNKKPGLFETRAFIQY
jgi:hypothetical protein